jgi:hypothetical protein
LVALASEVRRHRVGDRELILWFVDSAGVSDTMERDAARRCDLLQITAQHLLECQDGRPLRRLWNGLKLVRSLEGRIGLNFVGGEGGEIVRCLQSAHVPVDIHEAHCHTAISSSAVLPYPPKNPLVYPHRSPGIG